MSQATLSTHSLLELLALFDQANNTILDPDGNSLRGIPGWWIGSNTSLTAQILKDWTVRVGYAGTTEVPCGDDREYVELHETEDPGTYEYRSPETFRRKRVSADRVAILDVDSVKLLHLLADLLSIHQVKRGGIQAPRIDRMLWHLGEARIGPVNVPVWLARGLDTKVDEVFTSLLDTRLPEQGLILCAGAYLPRVIRPPRHYRIGYLRDALIDYSHRPTMDVHYLQRVLTSNEDGIKPSTIPVVFANGVLGITTKADTWTIKGDKQYKAVAYMFEQAQRGRWEVGAREILAAAYPELRTEELRKGLRMQDLFKGNKHWRQFIVSAGKGKYKFNLD